MTELEFKALAVQGYTRIPLIAESFADLETPLSLYLKLANEPNSFLLESVVGGERFGRYSFIGLPARTAIRSFIRDSGPVTEVVEDGKRRRDASRAIRWRRSSSSPRSSRSRSARVCRASPAASPATSATTPCASSRRSSRSRSRTTSACRTSCCCVTEEVAVIDNLAGRIYLIVYADPRKSGGLLARAGSGCAN